MSERDNWRPTDLLTLGRLGTALLAAGKPEEAIAIFQQRVAESPGDKGALLDLAAAYPRGRGVQLGGDRL